MKKYLKSKISLLALCAITTISLSGCKKKDNTITVTWWNNYKDPVVDKVDLEESKKSSTYNEYWFAKDVIAKFEQSHPNIKIEMTYKGGYNDIATEIKNGMATGNYPSLASGYPDNTAVYAENGITYDVSSLIDDERFGFGKVGSANATYTTEDDASLYSDDSSTSKSDFSSNFLSIEKTMYSGHLYSMPYSKSSEALLVNKDMMDKVGAGKAGTDTTTISKGEVVPSYTAPVAQASKTAYTLDANGDGTVTFGELVAVGRKAKADFPGVFGSDVNKDEKGLFLVAAPIVWDSAENLFITACEALGIPYLDANGSDASKQVLFNNDDAKKVVTYLKTLFDEGIFATKNQLYFSDEKKGYHQYPTQLLHDGKALAVISSTAGARYVVDDGYTADILSVPSFSASEMGLTGDKVSLKAISQGPSITFFQSQGGDVRIPRAAFEFYKFLTNSANSAELARKTAYFPLRTSASNTIINEYKNKTSKSDVAVGKMFELNNSYNEKKCNFMTQAFTYSAASRTAVGKLIDSVFTGTSVNEAFKNAYTSVVK